jgi:hypothetical protein
MIEAVMLGVQAYAALVLLWALYIMAMGLQPHLKTMHPIAKVHGCALFLLAAVFDVVVNWTVASALFLQLPQELMLTARLKRYHAPAYAGSWRAYLAEWICEHLLDQFDPRGKHC